MQSNLKISSIKATILTVLAFSFALVTFTGCHPDPLTEPNLPTEPNPTVVLEKKILDFYIPFKNVVIDEAKKQIIIYESDDLEKVTPIIEVSNGVTIQPASGVKIDESQPVTYTLTAKDGSTATYTLIVCVVDWEYQENLSGGFSITRMGQFKEPWTAVSQNGVLSLHFGTSTESALDIYFKSPISPALVTQFPVGNYTPANLPTGKAGVTFIYRENGIVKTFANPSAGNLVITAYDAAKGTISGNFGQVKYTGIGTSTQGNTYLSGTFEQLPLEIK